MRRNEMKNIKTLNNYFLAALCFCGIFFVSCEQALEPLRVEKPVSVTEESGSEVYTATITLAGDTKNFANRTIRPVGTTFSSYKITIKKDGAAIDGYNNVAFSGTLSLELEADTYSVTVEGYNTIGNTEVKAGTDTKNLVISAGGENTCALSLEPVSIDGSARGTFSWSIKLPSGVSAALSLLDADNSTAVDLNGDADGTSLSVTTTGSAITGSVPAVSGEYYVQIMLTQTSTGMTAIPLYELCYIYPGLTSTVIQDYSVMPVTFADKVYITGTVTVNNYFKTNTGNIILTGYKEGGIEQFSPAVSTIFTSPAYSGTEGAGTTVGVFTKTYVLGLPPEVAGTKPVVKVSFGDDLSSDNYIITYTNASPSANILASGKTEVNPRVTIFDTTAPLDAEVISNPAQLAESISTVCSGSTASSPRTLPIPNGVTAASLETLISAVNDAGAYVTLDLSYSGMSDADMETIGNMLDSSSDTGRDKIKGIFLPDGITSIGLSAFQSCTGLESVTIPDSVTIIRGVAFQGCTGLTSVTIPDSVTNIGGLAFNGCTGLTSVTIPDSVTSIDSSAFKGCTGLTSVTIPDSLTSIGDNAFNGCTGLTSVTIPDGVTSIVHNVFYGCTGLESVTIPDSVISIGGSAFVRCTGLTSVTIPDSVTNIGDNAFLGCTGLESVTIPDSVTSIGYAALYGCTGLESVTIPDSVTSIGYYTFSDCTGLTSVTIPDSVTSIGSSAFDGCTGLTSVTFATGSAIGSGNFGNDRSFPGDLRTRYLSGGAGTYVRDNGEDTTWTKQW
jgi:hypothetical protein